MVLPGPVGRSLRAVRTLIRRYTTHNLNDVAAGLSFWTFLSIFPALLAFASLLGAAHFIVGQDVVDEARQNITDFIVEHVNGQLGLDVAARVDDLLSSTRGGLAVISILVALWSMSKGFASLCRALATIHGCWERRKGLKGRAVGLLLGIGTITVLALVMLQSVLGPLFGLEKHLPQGGHWVVTVWGIGRTPVMALLLVTWTTVLLLVAPGHDSRLRFALPGALVATSVWGLTTVGFAIAIRLGVLRVNPILGSIGAILLFLTWLHMMSVGLLLGGELNAYLDEERSVLRPDEAERTDLPANDLTTDLGSTPSTATSA